MARLWCDVILSEGWCLLRSLCNNTRARATQARVTCAGVVFLAGATLRQNQQINDISTHVSQGTRQRHERSQDQPPGAGGGGERQHTHTHTHVALNRILRAELRCAAAPVYSSLLQSHMTNPILPAVLCKRIQRRPHGGLKRPFSPLQLFRKFQASMTVALVLLLTVCLLWQQQNLR